MPKNIPKKKGFLKKLSEFKFSFGFSPSAIRNAPIRSGSYNSRTGQGTILDPTTYLLSEAKRIPTEDILRLYQTNGLFSKIIDIYTDTAFSKPLIFPTLTKRKHKKLEEVFSSLRIQDELRDAFRLNYLKGGALIVLGIKEYGVPKDKSEPIEIHKLEKIVWAKAIDRDSFWFTENDIDWDIESQNYGNPYQYRFNDKKGKEITIHASRCLVFFGKKFIRGASLNTEAGAQINKTHNYRATGHDSQSLKDSVLGTSFCETLVNSVLSYQSAVRITLAAMMKNIREVVTYLPSENSLSPEEIEENVQSAVTMNTSVGTIIAPEGMDIKLLEGNPQGNVAILDSLFKDISTVTGIPQIHLRGQAPAGLGATRLAELKIFSDVMRGIQEKSLRDPWTNLLQIIINCSEYGLKIDNTPQFEFEDITSLSQIDKADVAIKEKNIEIMNQDILSKKIGNVLSLKDLNLSNEKINELLSLEAVT